MPDTFAPTVRTNAAVALTKHFWDEAYKITAYTDNAARLVQAMATNYQTLLLAEIAEHESRRAAVRPR